MDTTSELRIARLRTHFVVAALPGAPSPDSVRARLDPVLAGPFAEACAETVGALASASDPSVWVLRRVALDFALQIDGLPAPELARRWSGELARRVARAMREGADGIDVLRFPDRTAHLAHVVQSLAAGEDWDDAVFAPFEGVRALPREARLATLLARDPARTAALLVLLQGRGAMPPVIAALGDAGARQVLALWPREEGRLSVADVRRWAPLLRRVQVPGLDAAGEAWTLAAIAAALAGSPETSPGRLRALIEDLQSLLRALPTAAAPGPPGAAADDALAVDAWPRAWRALVREGTAGAIAEAIQPPRSPRSEARALAPEGGASSNAGALLLLASLASSGVDDDLARLDPRASVRPALRALVLAHAVGRAAAASDPLLHAACGAGPHDDPTATLRAALRHLRVRRLLTAPDVLARAGVPCRVRAAAPPHDGTGPREALVWRDATGDWCRVAPRSPGGPDAEPAEVSMAEEMQALDIDVVASAFAGHPGGPGRVRDDWARSLVFAWLARRVLRRFARGLPGFARSSVAHLRENFLARGGVLHREPAAWRLVLQAPPLSLVLRISGRHHDVVSLPWLGSLALRVTLEDVA
jgi:hypothetical protein